MIRPNPTYILLGLIVGTLGGVGASAVWGGTPGLEWVVTYLAEPAGQIFLRLLLLVVVPLVFTTLVLGVAGLRDTKRFGRLSAKTLGFFFGTTGLAALLGLVVVNVTRPGAVIGPALRATLMESFAAQGQDAVTRAADGVSISMLIDIIPRNPLEAAVNGDLLAVIFVTLLFGVAVTRLPRHLAEPILRLLEGVAHAVMVMIGFAMAIAPVGIAGLTFAVTARFGLDILAPLGLYTAVVLLGLAVYQFGLLGIVVRLWGGISPTAFFRAARLPMFTAFSTASSSATLPTTIRTAETDLAIPREVSGFVLPLGATMNMNGTAFFEAITVLFLAQAFGITLGVFAQVTVVVLAMLTAVSAAGIPSGSIPLIVVILETVGVPGESIALMLGVEPILGMARTSTNVTGDLVASVVIARGEGVP